MPYWQCLKAVSIQFFTHKIDAKSCLTLNTKQDDFRDLKFEVLKNIKSNNLEK